MEESLEGMLLVSSRSSLPLLDLSSVVKSTSSVHYHEAARLRRDPAVKIDLFAEQSNIRANYL